MRKSEKHPHPEPVEGSAKEKNMDPASTIDFARSAILVLLEIIAPSMITALVVGLGIGLLQAVTQIQEQTLVFVPKIVAVFIVLLLALPFAGAAMSGLMTEIAGRIAAY
jgi:flagellar biosynthesis protein FliQ